MQSGSRAWASKAVWGAAIVSILAPELECFGELSLSESTLRRGQWIYDCRRPGTGFSIERKVILIHSESADTYYGFSDVSRGSSDANDSVNWLEVVDFTPDNGSITVRLVDRDGHASVIEKVLTANKSKTQFKSSDAKSTSGPTYSISLTRPK